LAIVIGILVRVRRTARTPRFTPAIDAYVLALASALVGIALGVGFASGALPPETRGAHVLVNLFAFVGVVIAGTLPYFAATQARTKMTARATSRRLRAVSGTVWAGATAAAVAVALGRDDHAAPAIAAHALGVLALIPLLPAIRRKQLVWAGPRLLQLLAGVGWWAATAMWIAATYETSGLGRAQLLALVVGGYGQVLVASFAYLVPVVRGGGYEQLGAGFDRTRSWSGLALGNLAAAFGAFGRVDLMTAAVGAWLMDATIRTALPGRSHPGTRRTSP
jgi:hypothetical protein